MKRRQFTLSDLKNSRAAVLNQHLFNLSADREKRGSKYNNTKTTVDYIEFDSKKEANRYIELRHLLKIGAIGLLRLQVPYELNPGGTHSLKYIADFVYMDTVTGGETVEDAKGYKTKEYRKKKRLMKKVHNIIIKEV